MTGENVKITVILDEKKYFKNKQKIFLRKYIFKSKKIKNK